MFKDEHILGVANATQQTTYLVAYFTPNTPVADIIADTHKAMMAVVTKTGIRYGDFNCRLDYHDPQDTRASDLIEALLLIDLHLLNDAQTMTYHAHNGQSAIDLMFVSENPTSRADLKVLPTIDRKHQCLSLSVTLSDPGMKLTGNRPGPPLRRIRECDLNRHLLAVSQLPEHTPDETYQQFLALIEKSAQVQPLKKQKNEPWFDSECRSLKQLSLSKIGTVEYATTRRTYKAAIKKKRIEHELKEFERKVSVSKTKPWILLPQRKTPCLPKVDIPTSEEYYGNLHLSTEAVLPSGPARQHSGGSDDWYKAVLG